MSLPLQEATLPTITTPTAAATTTASSRAMHWPAWLREPLLHFVLLGGLLFALDHALVERADDPRTIIISTEVDQEARQIFSAARGRPPSADELAALRRVWLDNEVLYREGLALRVDRGDSAIRERVIFKALSVVDANNRRPAVDDPTLRAWFEQRRVHYDEPARYDFQEAALAGDTPEAELRSFVLALNSGSSGDAKAGLRVFKGRPQANLVSSYGPTFAKALDETPVGEWRALPSTGGLRVVQLLAISAPKPASFEALRGVLLQDWTDHVMAEQRSAAVRALGQKYTVKVEAAATAQAAVK